MNHNQNSWVVVVGPTEPLEAERAFSQWRYDNELWSAELSDSDIMIDTIRALGGKTLRRYRVRDIRPVDSR
jgi:hypothetical protein